MMVIQTVFCAGIFSFGHEEDFGMNKFGFLLLKMTPEGIWRVLFDYCSVLQAGHLVMKKIFGMSKFGLVPQGIWRDLLD